MSVIDEGPVYGECVGCDCHVFLRTHDYLMIEAEYGGGYLHRECRKEFEDANGPVVCEMDDEETANAKHGGGTYGNNGRSLSEVQTAQWETFKR